jgi:hypothetical protein
MIEVTVAKQSAVASQATEDSLVGRLASFFPEATRVRIPVRVKAMRRGSAPEENTVIEFGTPEEVLFASTLPLEFEDRVHLENADGSLRAEATVIALQYGGGGTAVAARFSRPVTNWIIKR